MSITDVALLVFVVLLLLYAIYDELVMDKLYGQTYLRVNLRRRNKLDSIIFIGLIAILIYKNITAQGSSFTSYLLFTLIGAMIYLFYIRWPKLLFKAQGFFYANVFIPYQRIKQMNLSEDGVLVIDLEVRRLLIYVNQLDDLEKILQIFVQHDLNAENESK